MKWMSREPIQLLPKILKNRRVWKPTRSQGRADPASIYGQGVYHCLAPSKTAPFTLQNRFLFRPSKTFDSIVVFNVQFNMINNGIDNVIQGT